jgi:hypothetical protein
LPGTGSAKMAVKVFRWVRFMHYMVSLFATMSREFSTDNHDHLAKTLQSSVSLEP